MSHHTTTPKEWKGVKRDCTISNQIFTICNKNIWNSTLDTLLTHKVVDSEPGEDALIPAVHDTNRVFGGVEPRCTQYHTHLWNIYIITFTFTLCIKVLLLVTRQDGGLQIPHSSTCNQIPCHLFPCVHSLDVSVALQSAICLTPI